MSRRPTRFSVRTLMLAVVLIGLPLGLRRHAVQQHQRVVADLRQLGAQLDSSENRSALAWILGTTSQVHGVHFLGPDIGDNDVEEITQAALRLRGLKLMTFAESSLSRQGEAQLRSHLDGVEITVWTPILAPPVELVPQMR